MRRRQQEAQEGARAAPELQQEQRNEQGPSHQDSVSTLHAHTCQAPGYTDGLSPYPNSVKYLSLEATAHYSYLLMFKEVKDGAEIGDSQDSNTGYSSSRCAFVLCGYK